ncbi:DUF4124 domain-containing protein [Niveibacterium sp.]|uniref:DUF4124 domain-containing protein n=1 Tax=Niveibacterium sp. TaxID=2017444 RepID=UPI0035B0AD9F
MPHITRFASLRLLRLIAACASGLVISMPAAAEVYKCADAQGKVSYSGTPCAAGSVRQQAVNAAPAAAGIDGVTRGAASAPSNTASASAATPEKFCPSERDIANLENRSTSITLDDKARAFIREEVRRARACSREDTRYTREDWARVERGIDAQNRSLERDREEGRAAALDTHSVSASAQERERIENEKNREALREAERQRDAAIQDAAWRPVARCDATACWDKGGNRYGKAANGNYVNAAGQACSLNGSKLHCQ